MERFIHRQNIEHYQRLLQTVTDKAEPSRVLKLLEEEKKKTDLAAKNETPGLDSLPRLVLPFSPVGWVNFDPLLGCSVYPAAKDTPAGEHQCVRRAAFVEDRQRKVAVEGRCRYWLPFHGRQNRARLRQRLLN